MSIDRRKFLSASAFALVACRRGLAAPTDGKSRVCTATPPDIEGPFYRPGAPTRQHLSKMPTLILTGVVRDKQCQVHKHAKLEFWHANPKGAYSMRSFDFRTTVFSDVRGHYRIETNVPGRYLNVNQYRPAHIHVKVSAGKRVLTTQLYFPDDPYNRIDPWFKPRLLMKLAPPQSNGVGRAQFDFFV